MCAMFEDTLFPTVKLSHNDWSITCLLINDDLQLHENPGKVHVVILPLSAGTSSQKALTPIMSPTNKNLSFSH